MLRDEIRVEARQTADGSWSATLDDSDHAAPTSDALVRALRRVFPDRTLIVEIRPRLLGVAEASAYLGWDKRRVITYVDRGSFPEPLETLAGGRIWALDDLQEFRSAFERRRARRAARAAAATGPPAAPAHSPPD